MRNQDTDIISPLTPLIIILGPTGIGKSELAVSIARRFRGTIISADSRQVYRGLDIGTAKIPGAWQTSGKRKRFIYKNIVHYCIDIASPRTTFSVARFQREAKAAIKEIHGQGKVPILAGGTGFWIDAVAFDLAFHSVKPDPILRKKLATMTPEALLALLIKLDPGRAATVEQKNPRRLMRAIEIANHRGSVPPLIKGTPYRILWIGIKPDNEILTERIKKRARRMVRGGIIAETQRLLKTGISRKRVAEFGFEYRAVLDHLDGRLSRKQLAETIARDSMRYVKRQMTWFKRNQEIRWISAGKEGVALAQEFVNGSPGRSS